MNYGKVAWKGAIVGKVAWKGAIVGLVFWLMSLILSKVNILGLKLTNLFALNVPLASGVTSGLGQKFFSYAQGLAPFSLMDALWFAIAGIIVVMIGTFALDVWPKISVSAKTRTWVGLLIGTAVVYVILAWPLKVIPFGAIFGAAIYYFIAALVLKLFKVEL